MLVSLAIAGTVAHAEYLQLLATLLRIALSRRCRRSSCCPCHLERATRSAQDLNGILPWLDDECLGSLISCVAREFCVLSFTQCVLTLLTPFPVVFVTLSILGISIRTLERFEWSPTTFDSCSLHRH